MTNDATNTPAEHTPAPEDPILATLREAMVTGKPVRIVGETSTPPRLWLGGERVVHVPITFTVPDEIVIPCTDPSA